MDIIALSTTPARTPSIAGAQAHVVLDDRRGDVLRIFATREGAVKHAFGCLEEAYGDEIDVLSRRQSKAFDKAKADLDLPTACAILDDFRFSVESLTIDD